jgi:hypothetical protein
MQLNDDGIAVAAGGTDTPIDGSPESGRDDGSNAGAGKRGRGRPPKSAGGSGGSAARVNPAALAGGTVSDDTAPARKRERKQTGKTEAALSLDTLVTALSVAQLSLVTMTGVPEFMLSPEQTKTLADATAKVTRHFPSVLTEKQQDIIALVGTAGAIAFAQFSAYNRRKFEEIEQKKAGALLNGGMQHVPN